MALPVLFLSTWLVSTTEGHSAYLTIHTTYIQQYVWQSNWIESLDALQGEADGKVAARRVAPHHDPRAGGAEEGEVVQHPAVWRIHESNLVKLCLGRSWFNFYQLFNWFLKGVRLVEWVTPAVAACRWWKAHRKVSWNWIKLISYPMKRICVSDS